MYNLKPNPQTVAAANATMRSLSKKFQTRRPVFRGNVTSVAVAPPETGGQVVRANVRLANGTVLPNVNVAGWGVNVGSHVSVRGGSTLLSGDYEIARVHSWGRGVITGNPHGFLSTPNIYDITTSLVNTNGNLVVVLNVTTECVVEHWRGRIPMRYIVEVLDEDLNQVDWIESAQYERTAGKVQSEISSGATSLVVNQYGDSNPPSMNFPRQGGVLRGGAELMFYPYGEPTSSVSFQFLSLARGYFGTTPQTHYVDRDISLAGITFATQGLLTNTVYKVRVMAKAADGRMSNWSDVVTVLTEVDVTPPTWSAGANLAVEQVGSGFRLRWDSADENILDLSHYNIQISDDGVTGGDIFNAGNGNAWVYPATPGAVQYFRIQAEDYTGNTGYEDSPFAEWSGWVRGVVILTEEPNGGGDTFNLVTNGKLTTDLSGWSIISSSGTASITRDTNHYFASSPASMRWQETRTGLQSTSEITFTELNVTAGQWLYVRAYVKAGVGFTNANDSVTIGLRLRRSTGPTITTPYKVYAGSEIPTDGSYLPVFFAYAVPHDLTKAQLLISIANDAGSGTPQLWIDDIFMTSYATGGAGYMIDANFSSNPGVASSPLKTDGSGGLTLESLTLTGTGDVETVLGQKLVKTANLSDLANAGTARTNLGLGNSATRNVGTTSGDVASGEYAQEIINARGGQANVDARIDLIDTAIANLARFYMMYSTNAGQSIASGSNARIDYEDMSFESVDYVTTGASWAFQPPAGVYRVTASIMFASYNWTAGDIIQIGVWKNGVAQNYNRLPLATLTSQLAQIQITTFVNMNGTDTLYISGGGAWSGGGSRNLSTDARHNYVVIDRV